MIHKIKISHLYYDDIQNGKKNFELRKDDRNYQVGDKLLLHEIKENSLTGRLIEVDVVYKLVNYVGLENGYCILGIKRK
ncbi:MULTISPECIES: DUF3850 domain-containing protein [Streptococcus]|uniref:DUF3850 domain-containing protein n=1 Tax=Streptococcus TaxID=1301 RepID=UPI000660236F|nr:MULTISPECIES: DUF3850 domain-containing protein [Streptococcus]MCW1051332.1 DUF3850 domain-containing protein [Streptococcus anginosus]MDN5012861.1 DUF3850 domain-containing protein [Streptococcus sp. SN3]